MPDWEPLLTVDVEVKPVERGRASTSLRCFLSSSTRACRWTFAQAGAM